MMNEVNRTLYIPLYGKSFVSRKGIILQDLKAESIWSSEGFILKGKSRSKWLAYYMGMRAAVFDRWLQGEIYHCPNAVVLHIGCGLDSRCERVERESTLWYDIDFPEVMEERRRYYTENNTYHMLSADVRTRVWMDSLPQARAIVVMEGVSMYMREEEIHQLMHALREHFQSVTLFMDCYTSFAANASKIKNPINDVGVTTVYGVDEPRIYESNTGFKFVREHCMTPEDLINELKGIERLVFKAVFAGSFAHRLYRLYEYKTACDDQKR